MRIRFSCNQLACEKEKEKKNKKNNWELKNSSFLTFRESWLACDIALMSPFCTRHMPKFFKFLRLVFKEQGKEARFYSWPKHFVSLISSSIGIRLFLFCNVGP